MVLDGDLRPGRTPTGADGVAGRHGARDPRELWSIISSSISSTTSSQGPTGRRRRRRPVASSWSEIGCTQCHIPDLRLAHDRRVADVETRYDPQRGALNGLFATATPLHDEVDDGSGLPTLKRPLLQPFLVRDVFTDFKRHDLGPEFHEPDFNGAVTTRFMTTPLWGVGSTAPYGHDGRSINLEEVILRHGGEAQSSREAFRDSRKSSRARCFGSSPRWCCSRRTTRRRISIPAVSASESCSMTSASRSNPTLFAARVVL